MPTAVSREGVTRTPDELDATNDAIEGLQRQIDSLSGDLQEIADRAILR